MQQRFLLQIILLAQHVLGTTMPIIRSSRVLYSGFCLWYFLLWYSSCWSGVELRVMCPVCRMLQHPANRTHNSHHPTLEHPQRKCERPSFRAIKNSRQNSLTMSVSSKSLVLQYTK